MGVRGGWYFTSAGLRRAIQPRGESRPRQARVGAQWRVLHFLGLLFLGLLLLDLGSPARAQVIREIRFVRDPIWTEDDYTRLPDLLLDTMNFLHVDTSKAFLARELTFAVGDSLDPGTLAESERRIRELRFLREVSISTETAAKDSVDVVVRTRETWTTSFGFRLESFQGETFVGLSLTERNFLGRGRRLGLRWDTTPDRSGWTFDYYHRQLLGTRNDWSLLWQDYTDGSRFFLEFARPWTSLDAPLRYEVYYDRAQDRPRYSLDSTHFVRARFDYEAVRLRVKWRLASDASRVLRAGPLVHWRKQSFREEDALVVQTTFEETGLYLDFPTDAPENRERLTFGLATELRSRRYEVLRYVDLMGRNEDFAMGHDLSFDLGWNAKAVAGVQGGLHLTWLHTYQRKAGSCLHRVGSESSGLIDAGKGRDLRFALGYRTNWFLGRGWGVATGLLGGWGERLDAHRPFTMGSESGLRSAGFREFTGDRLLRSNLECRWTYERGFWELFVPGLVAFADFGSIWYASEESFRWDTVRGALGFGLRFMTTTSTFGLPVRADLAWPVGARSGAGSPVFSLGTGQAF